MSSFAASSNYILNYMNFYMDKTKRILQANAGNANQIAILGATYGPIPISINNVWFSQNTDLNITISSALDTGSITPGTDYYIYACNNAGALAFVVSLNSTYPTGYSATTSRKIGGFHTLCSDVGTISGHSLTGFTNGQILPNSVWDLKFRAASLNNAGLVYDSKSNLWVQIYLASDNGAGGVQSVYGAAFLQSINWMDFVDKGANVGLRLLEDDQFQNIAYNCNELTNIWGTNSPVTTGKCAIVAQTTGSGLNDITLNSASNTLGPAGNQEYVITVTAGTPDTFTWKQRAFGGTLGSASSATNITGGWQTLANGVQIKFAATTGHTSTNVFTVWVSYGNFDTNARRMISNIGVEDAAGVIYQWLRDQSYRYDMAAANISPVAAAATITAYYAASPGGNPIYMKFGADGIPYLCCNMTDTTAHVLTFGTNQKVIIQHDASAASGGYQIYMNRSATDPGKILANITGGTYPLAKNVYIQTANYPDYYVQIVHDASAASDGIAINYNPTSTHLEAAFTNTVNNNFDSCYLAPVFAYYTLSGSQGSLYRQGDYGDVKLLAGGAWNNGSYCGSRCRAASYYRWDTSAGIGGRFCSLPL